MFDIFLDIFFLIYFTASVKLRKPELLSYKQLKPLKRTSPYINQPLNYILAFGNLFHFKCR